MDSPSRSTFSRLPVVVQVGFAGSRRFFDKKARPGIDETSFHRQVEDYLRQRLSVLKQDLGLAERHFLCGISQIAVGGDMIFTRACASLEICQRIYLPQTLDEFLKASSSGGTPDFSPQEQAEARSLAGLPHVIHHRLVSDSADRTQRFRDANLELLRVSDVMVCLLRLDAADKPGGTAEVMRHAMALGKPTLEIRVGISGDAPSFSHRWHLPQVSWRAPELLSGLEDVALPAEIHSPAPGVPVQAAAYLKALRSHGSLQARRKQRGFRLTALTVIGAHLLATICAALALAFHPSFPILAGLLVVELVFLAGGWRVHHRLHHNRLPQAWATHRLVAEVSRSLDALRQVHLYPAYLFNLPLPHAIRPLLRTISVIHLASSRNDKAGWETKLKNYVESRLEGPKGQIQYFADKLEKAKSTQKLTSRLFLAASGTAFLATLTKLVLSIQEHFAHADHGHGASMLPALLGATAIILPVIAVGAMSYAAALDLEARIHTYEDTLAFLRRTRPLFDLASTESAFVKLVSVTETNLLGEITNWASRRSFTSVT